MFLNFDLGNKYMRTSFAKTRRTRTWCVGFPQNARRTTMHSNAPNAASCVPHVESIFYLSCELATLHFGNFVYVIGSFEARLHGVFVRATNEMISVES